MGGKDEQAVLNNPLAVIPGAMRIKFKLTEVNCAAANDNLNDLQNFINIYPGNNAKERVDSYKNEALESMRGSMKQKLSNIVEPTSEVQAQGVKRFKEFTEKMNTLQNNLKKNDEALKKQDIPSNQSWLSQ